MIWLMGITIYILSIFGTRLIEKTVHKNDLHHILWFTPIINTLYCIAFIIVSIGVTIVMLLVAFINVLNVSNWFLIKKIKKFFNLFFNWFLIK